MRASLVAPDHRLESRWALTVAAGDGDQPAGGCDDTDAHWTELLAVVKQWHDQRPGSMPAAIALADASVGYGWKARGTDFSDTVTPEGWQLLHQRMAPAEEILMETAGTAVKTPDGAGLP